MKSPGDGLPPYELDEVLGRTLRDAARRPTMPSRSRCSAGRELARVSERAGPRPQSPSSTGALGKLGRRSGHGRCSGSRARVAARSTCRAAPSDAVAALASCAAGDAAAALDGDITDRASLEAARDAARRRGRRAWSAGQQRRHRPAARQRRPATHRARGHPARGRSAAWSKSTCSGAFQVTQVFGARMAARARGSIINIGSLYASVSPDPRFYDHLPATRRSSSRPPTAPRRRASST